MRVKDQKPDLPIFIIIIVTSIDSQNRKSLHVAPKHDRSPMSPKVLLDLRNYRPRFQLVSSRDVYYLTLDIEEIAHRQAYLEST